MNGGKLLEPFPCLTARFYEYYDTRTVGFYRADWEKTQPVSQGPYMEDHRHNQCKGCGVAKFVKLTKTCGQWDPNNNDNKCIQKNNWGGFIPPPKRALRRLLVQRDMCSAQVDPCLCTCLSKQYVRLTFAYRWLNTNQGLCIRHLDNLSQLQIASSK